MPSMAVSLPVLPTDRPMRLTPTDVTQFVRLEQCERFLRFRLAERAGQKFMEEYDVIPQRITPLLSLSGHDFEEGIEKTSASGSATINYAAKYRQAHDRPGNNAEVVDEARKLLPGQSVLLFQPRLEAELARLAAAGRRGPAAAGADRGRHAARPDRRHEVHRRGQGRTPPPGRLLPADAGADLLKDAGIAHAPIQTGILFRPPADPTPEEEEEIKPLREAAQAVFGLDDALLEVVADPDAYLQSAHDLVLGKDSTARRVARHPVRGHPVLPVVQVRRLPVQRVLHEVECRAGRPLAAPVHDRHREGGPAAGRRHHGPVPRHAQGLRPADGTATPTNSSRPPAGRPRSSRSPPPGRSAPGSTNWSTGPGASAAPSARTAPQALSYIPGKGNSTPAGVEARPEPEPRPHLPRRPAGLPRRPGLPARCPGRRLQGRHAGRAGGPWSA